MKKVMIGILVLIPIIILLLVAMVSAIVSTQAWISVEDIRLKYKGTDVETDEISYSLDESSTDVFNLNDMIDVVVLPEKANKYVIEWQIYGKVDYTDSEYQKKYEENLKTDYPRIPFYKDFDKFVELGRRLIKLQTEFDNKQESHCEATAEANQSEIIQKVDCHAYARNDDNNNVARSASLREAHCVNNSETGKINLKIEKDFKYMPEDFTAMKLNKEKGILTFDGKNRIENIPKKAFDYKIASKSALEWVIHYYSYKNLRPDKEPDHKTLIENGLNSYDYKKIREYLFDLIPKVISISVESVDIFEELERLD